MFFVFVGVVRNSKRRRLLRRHRGEVRRVSLARLRKSGRKLTSFFGVLYFAFVDYYECVFLFRFNVDREEKL